MALVSRPDASRKFTVESIQIYKLVGMNAFEAIDNATSSPAKIQPVWLAAYFWKFG